MGDIGSTGSIPSAPGIKEEEGGGLMIRPVLMESNQIKQKMEKIGQINRGDERKRRRKMQAIESDNSLSREIGIDHDIKNEYEGGSATKQTSKN